ncbi:EI24 domain-containing protein, partial [Octadecabacter sp.]|nr:EI24 domain-containing protein [Octadecabacter sp.]
PVASAITSLFLDDVADAVEVRHYPHLPPAPRITFGEAFRDTVNFLGVMIGVNLVALIFLPLYWFAAPFVFYMINGWLLGREYFTVAALRREGREGANALRKQHRGAIWFAGIVMAVPLTIPVVNLLVPILGAATFTHFYHRIARTA